MYGGKIQAEEQTGLRSGGEVFGPQQLLGGWARLGVGRAGRYGSGAKQRKACVVQLAAAQILQKLGL